MYKLLHVRLKAVNQHLSENFVYDITQRYRSKLCYIILILCFKDDDNKGFINNRIEIPRIKSLRDQTMDRGSNDILVFLEKKFMVFIWPRIFVWFHQFHGFSDFLNSTFQVSYK